MAATKPAEGETGKAEVAAEVAAEAAPAVETESEEIGYRVVAVRFTADFEYEESNAAVRVYPSGWSGEIPEARATAALDQEKAELI